MRAEYKDVVLTFPLRLIVILAITPSLLACQSTKTATRARGEEKHTRQQSVLSNREYKNHSSTTSDPDRPLLLNYLPSFPNDNWKGEQLSPDLNRSLLTRQSQFHIFMLIRNCNEKSQTQHVDIAGYTGSDGEHVPVVPNTTDANKTINHHGEIYVSPWGEATLAFLRDWKCPDVLCGVVELHSLTVQRNFKVAPQSRTTLPYRTVRPMAHDQSIPHVERLNVTRNYPEPARQ